ncbi:hypothetical protein ASPVEDRAFT_48021 [Aspergillus versicolor CBS 583.65]|uniref:Phytanoyl-CoA dioxygenase n=1 Tax=Aspergillus versicolor CBS 583.65 TaxID=1036611 RepID=A0A1L9Q583_ASPVE|nr:uncharacterized protein ASPVEDRAFT_48021 [Aspergillus versicolor CBS 583.65]OJJ08889.1 hypothetical protein ASPVEDRAFT_48021 [Aspergillus versicolor CBS 583.65]
MSTYTESIVSTHTADRPALQLTGGSGINETPKWLVELSTKGWTVVHETIPKVKALEYADKAYDWLESWNLGFDRNDPSTRKASNLPYHIRGGLYNAYGIGHEQFVWDLKSEPGLVEKWEQIWGTSDLLVSFDGINLSMPEKERPKTDPVFAPWSHVDQSPFNTRFDTVQGILNLLPNGPEDGGLMILEGSSSFYSELWQRFDHKQGDGWNKSAFQFVDEEMCQWLESKGCKWTKVCAQPGDLLLWDSRTIHYGAAPSSTNDRFAAYVCYKPASSVSDEAKKVRIEAFNSKKNTTHDPANFRIRDRQPPSDHPSYEEAVKRPLQDPVLSKRARELIGLDA